MQNDKLQNNDGAYIVKKTGQKESFFQTVSEIWAYRQMIASFVRRDLRGRYKGSVLGFLWTFINPLLQLLVYTVVFGTLLRSTTPNYHLHLFVALIPWIFFASSVTGGALSVISQKEMVKKIYFPREVLPIATVTTNFINMLLCFIVVFAVVFFTGLSTGTFPSVLGILCLIPVFAVEYVLSLGMAFLAASVTVYFRDMEHILGILIMAWQYLTPVLYGLSIFEGYENYATIQKLFNLNPMTPIITAYRTILYECRVPDLTTLLWALVLGVTVLVIGWFAFTKLKRRFAEEL